MQMLLPDRLSRAARQPDKTEIIERRSIRGKIAKGTEVKRQRESGKGGQEDFNPSSRAKFRSIEISVLRRINIHDLHIEWNRVRDGLCNRSKNSIRGNEALISCMDRLNVGVSCTKVSRRKRIERLDTA